MSIAILIISFLITFVSYRCGLKDGMRVKDGKPIEKIIQKKKAKQGEVDSRLVEGFQNILNYQNRRNIK